MRTLKKALLILLVVNILRIIPGCCECDDSTMPFNFNRLTINNLDNSGDWAMTTTSDTMVAAAVAFEVALFDSSGYYYFAQGPPVNTGGFCSAMAMKCDCASLLKANQYLKDILITTLYSLNPEIDAGSDVTEWFVARPTNTGASGNSLYLSLESLCLQSEGKTYYDSGMESFGLYLTIPVANSHARFVIKTIFSDNITLSDTTRLISILNPERK